MASQVPLGWGIRMLRFLSESWSELTQLWESSGIMGRSPEGGGAAADTSRAVRAKAAKSQAARTGQQRLRSRVVPQAWLTPPKSSLERSRRQIWERVWVGYAGTVLKDGEFPGLRGCAAVNHIEAKKTRPPTEEVMNNCIFFGFGGLEVLLVLVGSGNDVPGKTKD